MKRETLSLFLVLSPLAVNLLKMDDPLSAYLLSIILLK
jgi:hypothetical protein